jgi:hypothetical protein
MCACISVRCRLPAAARSLNINSAFRTARTTPNRKAGHRRRPSATRLAATALADCTALTTPAKNSPPARRSAAARATANNLLNRSAWTRRVNHNFCRLSTAAPAADADSQRWSPRATRGCHPRRCRRIPAPRRTRAGCRFLLASPRRRREAEGVGVTTCLTGGFVSTSEAPPNSLGAEAGSPN